MQLVRFLSNALNLAIYNPCTLVVSGALFSRHRHARAWSSGDINKRSLNSAGTVPGKQFRCGGDLWCGFAILAVRFVIPVSRMGRGRVHYASEAYGRVSRKFTRGVSLGSFTYANEQWIRLV